MVFKNKSVALHPKINHLEPVVEECIGTWETLNALRHERPFKHEDWSVGAPLRRRRLKLIRMVPQKAIQDWQELGVYSEIIMMNDWLDPH